MPPPTRVRIHKNLGSGKLKSISKPPTLPSTSQASSSNENQEQQEAQEKFELELTWCIQRLEETVNGGKLNKKQTEDALKTIKILKSSAQPTVKKRQIMRQTFGDYRAKMTEDEQTYSINLNAFKFASNTSSRKKSYFVKKAAIINEEKNFKFNFDIDNKLDELTLTEEKPSTSNEMNVEKQNVTTTTKIHYKPSNNEFRFNFAVGSEES